MSWRTSPLIVTARNLGRKLGINRWLAVWLNGPGYETRYDTGFTGALRQGDYVWDVGANVGYYTRLFAERVGADGQVFAFEPTPTNFARLLSNTSNLTNVRLRPYGLGQANGQLAFQQGSDDLGATSRVIEEAGGGRMVVEIRAAASVIHDGEALPPNAIKIDVEGFEYEVLQGLGERLGDPTLHTVGIEVHFGILQARGMGQVPQQLEALLQSQGFTVVWPDSSHILATRG
jgi:FkbM family methyltransferase